jgi:hypothetical protein
MNENALTLLIVCLGTATVILSAYVAWRFWCLNKSLKNDGKKLSLALLLQLIGEGVMGAVTLVFSILHWYGAYDTIPVEVASFLRVVAFGATGLTTIHLCKVVEFLHSQK